MKHPIIFLLLGLLSSEFIKAQEIGPNGFEPTYLYSDNDLVTWIGTGSSGGIFKCTKNGECVAVNNPFGPATITWIERIGGILYTKADRFFYQLDERNLIWKQITNNNTSEMLSKIEKFSLESQQNTLQALLNEKHIKLPYIYNYISVKGGQLKVLSPYGIYEIKGPQHENLSKIELNINAGDIFQIGKNSKGNILCLTHERDIYEFKNKEWVKIFSFEQNTPMKDFLKDGLGKETKLSKPQTFENEFYENGSFRTYANTILYCVDSVIFSINPEEKEIKRIASPFKINCLEASLYGDTLEVYGDVVKYANFYSYKKAKYIHDAWDIESKEFYCSILPIQPQGNNTGRASQGIPAQYVKYFKPHPLSKRYLYNENPINTKILSYFFDKEYMYLGTSGSGILKFLIKGTP